MTRSVLDASALVALIKKEEGSEIVEQALPHAVMSAVNVTEAIRVLCRASFSFQEATTFLDILIGDVVTFNRAYSYQAGSLEDTAKQYGLSLGDCACLSLAKEISAPVYTADRVWLKAADTLGIDVRLIRE
jgi:ribonuclease VapC